jgi:hypothetical protein
MFCVSFNNLTVLTGLAVLMESAHREDCCQLESGKPADPPPPAHLGFQKLWLSNVLDMFYADGFS